VIVLTRCTYYSSGSQRTHLNKITEFIDTALLGKGARVEMND